MGADFVYPRADYQALILLAIQESSVDQPLVAISNRPARLLLLADSGGGAVLFKELSALGYDIYWARDSMEARWLWLPNFYESVVISLTDVSGADGLLARIRTEGPNQNVHFVTTVEQRSATILTMPTRSHRLTTAENSARRSTLSCKVIEIPKSPSGPKR